MCWTEDVRKEYTSDKSSILVATVIVYNKVNKENEINTCRYRLLNVIKLLIFIKKKKNYNKAVYS